MNTIVCDNCGNTIEISHALEAQIRRSVEDQVKKESQKELEQALKAAEEKALKRVSERFQMEEKQRVVENEENKKQNRELREQLIGLTKRLQEEKIRSENIELEMRKKFLETQDVLFKEAKSKAEEEHKMKISELMKQLSDVAKVNEELKRKVEQRSQQLQGEVQELDLEHTLRQTFIYDAIEAVGKGVRGADIRQVVKTQLGNVCGVILWESKQTKQWSREWVEKLKIDMRSEKANIPIIVSTQLPDEAKSGFGFIDGVYVVTPPLTLPIAELMRQKLIDLAREKFVLQNKGDKADDLYAYITSHEFRQQLEAVFEAYEDMQRQITKERVVFEKLWKTREAQIAKMVTGTSRVIGSMRGIIGPSLPSVAGLELGSEEADNEHA